MEKEKKPLYTKKNAWYICNVRNCFTRSLSEDIAERHAKEEHGAGKIELRRAETTFWEQSDKVTNGSAVGTTVAAIAILGSIIVLGSIAASKKKKEALDELIREE